MDRAVQAGHGVAPRQRATRADARPLRQGLVGTRILNVSVGWKISGNFAPPLPEKNVGRIFSQQMRVYDRSGPGAFGHRDADAIDYAS
jgi:hypothetical protein